MKPKSCFGPSFQL